jgi:hypothetical protein
MRVKSARLGLVAVLPPLVFAGLSAAAATSRAQSPTPTPVPPNNACKDIPDTRALVVANEGTKPIWVGGGGAALRAMCAFSDNTSCIPQVFNATSCQCTASGPPGTLACPGTSVPANGGENCAATGTQTCGTTAAPNGDNHYCYFQLPNPTKITGVPGRDPANWEWKLPPGGQADFCLSPASVSYNGEQIPSDVWWSGGVFARSGCLSTAGASGTVCAAGDCSAEPGSNCPAGKGGTNPATIAEFTLQRTQVDFYDITSINGANVTEKMQPEPEPTKAPPSASLTNYWCKDPGAKTSSIAGKDCSWDLAPYTAEVPFPGGKANKTPLLLNTTRLCDPPPAPGNPPSRFPACPAGYTCSGKGGVCFKTCTSDSDCSGSLKCVAASNGASYCQCQQESDCSSNPEPDKYCGSEFGIGLGVYLQQCGPFEGWWSADDFCSDPNTNYGGLNCGALFPDGDSTNTNPSNTNLSSLFLCAQKGAPPNQGNIKNGSSCYSVNENGCCGCATSTANPLVTDWPDDATGPCAGNNAVWAEKIQPWLVNLKKSCPTAYTYPYDDFTSTFQCQGTGNINLLGYKITFGDVPAPTVSQLLELEDSNPVSDDNSEAGSD